MAIEHDLRLGDGRTLHVHDTGPDDTTTATVVWHHGSPQTGALLEPLAAAAAARRIRLVSYGRPGYGGSTPLPGRDVASAAADVAAIADALGIERYAAMGASGGGPHALACAALDPARVTRTAVLAGIAPFTDDFDWWAGMVSPDGLRAALAGRNARERFAATESFDPESFAAADWGALAGRWASLGADASAASEGPSDGAVDDDVAFVSPWGFSLADVRTRVLFVQGGADRVVPPAHGEWSARQTPRSELWLRPDDGHIAVLDASPMALEWLLVRDEVG